MHRKLMIIGSLAALGCAATFVFGFVLLVTQLMPYSELKHNPEQAVEFVLSNIAILSLWNFVIYIVFGVLLTVLTVVLHQQLSPADPVLSQLASVFGIVWITLVIGSGMLGNVGLTRVVALAELHPDAAQSLWLSVITIKEGTGGSNEIVGGLWVMLVSMAFWRNRVYHRILAGTGLVAGVAGVLSTVPVLGDLGAVFGLLLIVWFVFLGCVMMRGSATAVQTLHIES